MKHIILKTKGLFMLFFIAVSSFLSAQTVEINLTDPQNASTTIGDPVGVPYNLVFTNNETDNLTLTGTYTLSTTIEGIYFVETGSSSNGLVIPVSVADDHLTLSFELNNLELTPGESVSFDFNVHAGHAFNLVASSVSISNYLDFSKEENGILLTPPKLIVNSAGIVVIPGLIIPEDNRDYVGGANVITRKYRVVNTSGFPIDGFLYFKEDIAPAIKVLALKIIQETNEIDLDITNIEEGISIPVSQLNGTIVIEETVEYVGACNKFPGLDNSDVRKTSFFQLNWGVFSYDLGPIRPSDSNEQVISNTTYTFDNQSDIRITEAENISDKDYQCLNTASNKRYSVTFTNQGNNSSIEGDLVIDVNRSSALRVKRSDVKLFKGPTGGPYVEYTPLFNNDLIINTNNPKDPAFLENVYSQTFSFDSPNVNDNIPDLIFQSNNAISPDLMLTSDEILVRIKNDNIGVDENGRDLFNNNYKNQDRLYKFNVQNTSFFTDNQYINDGTNPNVLYIERLTIDFMQDENGNLVNTVLHPNEELRIEWAEDVSCLIPDQFGGSNSIRRANVAYRYYAGNCTPVLTESYDLTIPVDATIQPPLFMSIGSNAPSVAEPVGFQLAADPDFCSETYDGTTDVLDFPIDFSYGFNIPSVDKYNRIKGADLGSFIFEVNLEPGIDLDNSFESLVDDLISSGPGAGNYGTDGSDECENGNCDNCGNKLNPVLASESLENFNLFFVDNNLTKINILPIIMNDFSTRFSVDTQEDIPFDFPTKPTASANIKYTFIVPIEEILKEVLGLDENTSDRLFSVGEINLINNYKFNFGIRTYCTSSSDVPVGRVNYYYNECPNNLETCANYAINSYLFEVNNPCPGCVTPGTNISTPRISRLNRGFIDDNNDRIPDDVNTDGVLDDRDRIPENDERLEAFTTGDEIISEFDIIVSNGEPFSTLTKNSLTFNNLEEPSRMVDLDNLYIEYSRNQEDYLMTDASVEVILNDGTILEAVQGSLILTDPIKNAFRMNSRSFIDENGNPLTNFHQVRVFKIKQKFIVKYSGLDPIILDGSLAAGLSPCDDCEIIQRDLDDIMNYLENIDVEDRLTEERITNDKAFFFCTNNIFSNQYYPYRTGVEFTAADLSRIRNGCSPTISFVTRGGDLSRNFKSNFPREYRSYFNKGFNLTVPIPEGYSVKQVGISNTGKNNVNQNINQIIRVPGNLWTSKISPIISNNDYDQELSITLQDFIVSPNIDDYFNSEVNISTTSTLSIDEIFMQNRFSSFDEMHIVNIGVSLESETSCANVPEEVNYDITTLPLELPSTTLPKVSSVNGETNESLDPSIFRDLNLFTTKRLDENRLTVNSVNRQIRRPLGRLVTNSIGSTDVIFNQSGAQTIQVGISFSATSPPNYGNSLPNAFLELDLSEVSGIIPTVARLENGTELNVFLDDITGKYYIITNESIGRGTSLVVDIDLTFSCEAGGCNPITGCDIDESTDQNCLLNNSLFIRSGWDCNPINDVNDLSSSCGFDEDTNVKEYLISSRPVGVSVDRQELTRFNAVTQTEEGVNIITQCDDLNLNVTLNSCQNGAINGLSYTINLPDGLLVNGVSIINRSDLEAVVVRNPVTNAHTITFTRIINGQPVIEGIPLLFRGISDVENVLTAIIEMKINLVSSCDLELIENFKDEISTYADVVTYCGGETRRVVNDNFVPILLINEVSAVDDLSLDMSCPEGNNPDERMFVITNLRDFETQGINTLTIDLPLDQIDLGTLPANSTLDPTAQTLTLSLETIPANGEVVVNLEYTTKETVLCDEDIVFTANLISEAIPYCENKGVTTCDPIPSKTKTVSCTYRIPQPEVGLEINLLGEYCQDNTTLNLLDALVVTTEEDVDPAKGEFFVNGVLSNTLSLNTTGTFEIRYVLSYCDYIYETTKTVTINSLPIVDAGEDRILCEGEEFTLTGAGDLLGATLSWNTGGVEVSTEASYTSTTSQDGVFSYEFSITNDKGCVNSDLVDVTVNESPRDVNITTEDEFEICPGTSILLVANTSNFTETEVSYQWFKDNVLLAGATEMAYQANEIGLYKVEIISNEVCAVTSDEIEIVESDRCCEIPEESFSITYSEDITISEPTAWLGKIHVLTGVTVTFDENATLDASNVDVVFDACSGLNFTGNSKISSTNSVYRTCDQTVKWNGVSIDNAENVEFTECTFKNGKVALNVMNGDAKIYNNSFVNNDQSIVLESLASASGIAVTSNNFLIDNEVPMFSCDDESETEYGFIKIQNSSFAPEISQNIFVDRATGSLVTGITSFNSPLIVSKNEFTDLDQSVHVSESISKEVIIESNEVSVGLNKSLALDQIKIEGSTNSSIRYNELHSTSSFAEDNFSSFALAIENSANAMIYENTISGFNKGIGAVNLNGSQIVSNKLLKNAMYGVFSNNSDNLSIKCNEIDMDNFEGSLSSDEQFIDQGVGIFFEGLVGENYEIYSNCILNSTVGILATYSGEIPDIRNNYFSNYSFRGIHFTSSTGNIGEEDRPGMNTFLSNSSEDIIDIYQSEEFDSWNNFGDNVIIYGISSNSAKEKKNNNFDSQSRASCRGAISGESGSFGKQTSLNQLLLCDLAEQSSFGINDVILSTISKHEIPYFYQGDGNFKQSRNIIITPNPVNNRLMVHFKTSSDLDSREMVITSMDGRIIFVKSLNETINGSILLDVEFLLPGVYLLAFKGDGRLLYTERFVKE